jgi:hypothetical protein
LFSFVLNASDDTLITPVPKECEANDGKCRCAEKGLDEPAGNEVAAIALTEQAGYVVRKPMNNEPSWASQKLVNSVTITRFASTAALAETHEIHRRNFLNGVFGVFPKTAGP